MTMMAAQASNSHPGSNLHYTRPPCRMAVQASQKEVHWQPWSTSESHVPCGLGRIAGIPIKVVPTTWLSPRHARCCG